MSRQFETPSTAHSTHRIYFCEDGSTVSGPIRYYDFLQAVEDGALSSSTKVCIEGSDEWIKIDELKLRIKEPSADGQHLQTNESEKTPGYLSRMGWKGKLAALAALIAMGLIVVSSIQRGPGPVFDDFILEAGQLATLTSYGVNRRDFIAQLAVVEKLWNKVDRSRIPKEARSHFYDAILDWKSVVRNWDNGEMDQSGLFGINPSHLMRDASESFYRGEKAMK